MSHERWKIEFKMKPEEATEALKLQGVIVDFEEEIARLRSALVEIEGLSPDVDSDNGFNEWGWADCAHKAKSIAKEALG